MRDNLSGGERKLVNSPIEWKILKYRQAMGVTYEEVMRLPQSVFVNDLIMLDLERSMLSQNNPKPVNIGLGE